jgi:hypothetical protein
LRALYDEYHFYRRQNMSKLADFYQQAHTDSVLKAELTQAYVAGVIGVAGNHGVSLAAADFVPSSGAPLRLKRKDRFPRIVINEKLALTDDVHPDKHIVELPGPD